MSLCCPTERRQGMPGFKDFISIMAICSWGVKCTAIRTAQRLRVTSQTTVHRPFPPGTRLTTTRLTQTAHKRFQRLRALPSMLRILRIRLPPWRWNTWAEPPATPTGVTVREADGITSNPNPPKFCAADYSGNAPPSNADVDTGLDIETGDIITVTATGSIWTGYCFTVRNLADGFANNANADCPLETAHEQALIGRVGNRSYFEIGSGSSGQFHIPAHVN